VISPMTVRTDLGWPVATYIPLIRTLADKLETEKIAYCHWKSTVGLERSLSGQTDLDLLIRRADAQRFGEVLFQLGFKLVKIASRRDLPGVVNYYGYDHSSGVFVHVDAHFNLVFGDDMTKNYHLPLERLFLESTTRKAVLRIPAPEAEFVVFVIRMLLKYSVWDCVLSWNRRMPASGREELSYLQVRVNRMKLERLLREHLPFLPLALFDDCVRSLQGRYPRWKEALIAARLERCLREHARRRRTADVARKLMRRARLLVSRLVHGRPRKYLMNGGALIALVGGDGSGKSTAVNELYAWLSPHFYTMKVHMGRPGNSRGGATVRDAFFEGPIGRTLRRHISTPSRGTPWSGVMRTRLWLLQRVWTARQRCRAYSRARRFASNGGIVICDRFPLPQVSLMDGLLGGRVFENTTLVDEYLLRRGRLYYARILLPDLLIVLRVDPEVAIARKRDDEPESVRRRNREIWNMDWRPTPAAVVDANPSQPQVVARLKSLIWASL
jgi:thymidylate kinase